MVPDPSRPQAPLLARMRPAPVPAGAAVATAIGMVVAASALAALIAVSIVGLGIAVPRWMGAVLIGVVLAVSMATLVVIGVRHVQACRSLRRRRSTYHTVSVDLRQSWRR